MKLEFIRDSNQKQNIIENLEKSDKSESVILISQTFISYP